MKIEENEVYTTKEVAEILKISLPTIKRMLKDRRLPSTRIGRQHRFLGRDLLDILRMQKDISARHDNKAGAAADAPPCVQTTTTAHAEEPEPARLSPELRRRSYMLGKRLRADLLDEAGSLIFSKGTVVTEETIQEAGRRRKLMELFSNLE